jgi:hypothetical protein
MEIVRERAPTILSSPRLESVRYGSMLELAAR